MTINTIAPSEDDISLFCDIATGLSRAEAIKRLQANNNNLQQATEEYFENPDSTKYQWDESLFTGDREGNNAGVSFNIQGPDGLPTSYHSSTAPTRPPSRTNNRSPLVEGAPANSTEEDAALQRALAESAAESGIPQETGVVDFDSNVKYFGPANRSEYDSAQWAMVPTKASTEATSSDPKPSSRKRQPGTPAFLRQLKDCRLGSLLTVYHSIPLVRNILLRYPSSTRTYGHNSEWWKGQQILKPEILTAMARGEVVPDDDTHPAFGEELHRLMAFLDNTERSYGTVDALTETTAIDPSGGQNTWGMDYDNRFIDHLIEENNSTPEFDVTPMISIGAIVPSASSSTNDSFDDGDSYENEQSPVNFALLDVTLSQDQWAWVKTLYDALDELLWTKAIATDEEAPDHTDTAMLVRPAEVITIRFSGAGLQKPCDIPATFYADRYMESRQELARHFQSQIHNIRRNGLQRLSKWEEHRVMCRGEPGCSKYVWLGHPHDVRSCRKKIVDTFEELVKRQRRNAQWRYYEERWAKGIPYSMNDLRLISTWTGPYELTAEEQAKHDKWERAIQIAKYDLERLDRELAICAEKRKEFQHMLDVVSKRLTCQEHEADDELFVYRSNPEKYHPEYWNPTQKYSLRGVSLSKESAYVCTREADLIDMGEEHNTRDQWWRIETPSDPSSPPKVEKVSLDDALQAAGTGSKWPILVYATEKAVETTPTPLPDSLRMFVKADNRSFQQELTQEQNQEQQQPQPPLEELSGSVSAPITSDTLSRIPSSSPTKRKHSPGSSVATNGSLRDDLTDVNLTFPDDDNYHGGGGGVGFDGRRDSSEDAQPMATHQEFTTHHHESDSPRSTKLGGLVESLANFQTNDAIGAASSSPGPVKTPEMQERARDAGPARLFNSGTSGGTTLPNEEIGGGGGGSGTTVDMMDMDIDVDMDAETYQNRQQQT